MRNWKRNWLSSKTGAAPQNVQAEEHDLTVVIGGLNEFHSLDDAQNWVWKQMWHVYGHDVRDVLCEGDFPWIGVCYVFD